MSELDLANEGLYDCIEDVLSHSMGRKAAPEEQMLRIRFRYPSPAFFIDSNEHMLKQAGLTNADAFYFWMIPGLTRYAARESFGDKPRLDTLSKMAAYLRSLYIGAHVESFYAVLLDGKGCLIRTVMVGQGTLDAAPFNMGKLLSLIVEHGAKAVALCHNHPCGTLRPSQEDLQCTLRAMAATATIDVPLLDHIIIARDRPVSIRDCGYIPADLWIMQGRKRRIVRDWIDVDLMQ